MSGQNGFFCTEFSHALGFPDVKGNCLSTCCIFVRKLAESCGMEYTCADGSLAFFGLYAF